MVNKKKPTIILSSKSPGPTKYFDPVTYQYLDGKIVFELVDSNVAELEIADSIPYIITLDVKAGSYLDTTKSCLISEAEAKKLVNSGVALLKIAVNSHPLISDEAKENVAPVTDHPSGPGSKTEEKNDSKSSDLKEKVLIGATAAGGTTAVAAGVASVPFLAGFSSAGVVAGSAAAGVQAGIGSVAAGSWFAVMQSVAATTVIGTALPLVAAGVAVAGTATAGVMLHKHWKEKKQIKEEETMKEIESKEAKAKYAEALVVAVGEDQECVLHDDDDGPLLNPRDEPPAYEPPPPYTYKP